MGIGVLRSLSIIIIQLRLDRNPVSKPRPTSLADDDIVPIP
jgi:hypothetical protein